MLRATEIHIFNISDPTCYPHITISSTGKFKGLFIIHPGYYFITIDQFDPIGL